MSQNVRVFAVAILTTVCLCITSLTAGAQTVAREKVNSGTVGILVEPHGSSLRIVRDMASVLDEKDGLRVVPVIGKGSQQGVDDVLYLRGIDAAIIQSDALKLAPKNKLARVRLISQLYTEELHIVTRREVSSIIELNGQKVNMISSQSGARVTAEAVFAAAGINVEPIFVDTKTGLQLVRRGDIAATVFVTGKPDAILSRISSEDGLHLLPVDHFSALPKEYMPRTFIAQDYPGLIGPGQKVSTIGTSAVLAVYDHRAKSPRHRKVMKFVDSFLKNFDQFREPPRDLKWQEVDLTVEMAELQRFKPVQTWIKQAKLSSTGGGDDAPSLRKSFQIFLQAELKRTGGKELTQVQKTQLFERFLDWQLSRQ